MNEASRKTKSGSTRAAAFSCSRRWLLLSAFLVGTDILDDLGNGSGAIGFTPPLPSGDYSFWIQQTADLQVDYSLQFNVSGSAVPVPAALYLFGSGLLALGGYVRGRSRNGAA